MRGFSSPAGCSRSLFSGKPQMAPGDGFSGSGPRSSASAHSRSSGVGVNDSVEGRCSSSSSLVGFASGFERFIVVGSKFNVFEGVKGGPCNPPPGLTSEDNASLQSIEGGRLARHHLEHGVRGVPLAPGAIFAKPCPIGFGRLEPAACGRAGGDGVRGGENAVTEKSVRVDGNRGVEKNG